MRYFFLPISFLCFATLSSATEVENATRATIHLSHEELVRALDSFTGFDDCLEKAGNTLDKSRTHCSKDYKPETSIHTQCVKDARQDYRTDVNACKSAFNSVSVQTPVVNFESAHKEKGDRQPAKKN